MTGESHLLPHRGAGLSDGARLSRRHSTRGRSPGGFAPLVSSRPGATPADDSEKDARPIVFSASWPPVTRDRNESKNWPRKSSTPHSISCRDRSTAWSICAAPPNDHVLVFAIHHAIADGWSLGVFVQDLFAAYIQALMGAAEPLPPVPLSYTAWGATERAFWQPALLDQRTAFWKLNLADSGPGCGMSPIAAGPSPAMAFENSGAGR